MLIRSLLLIIFVSGCSSFNLEPPTLIVELCGEMVGKDSQTIPAPPNQHKPMLLSINVPKRATGFLWYENKNHNYFVCAYTNDKDGCGTHAYEIRFLNGKWKGELISSLERICVVG